MMRAGSAKNQNCFLFALKNAFFSFNLFHSGGVTQENEQIRSVANAPFSTMSFSSPSSSLLVGLGSHINGLSQVHPPPPPQIQISPIRSTKNATFWPFESRFQKLGLGLHPPQGCPKNLNIQIFKMLPKIVVLIPLSHRLLN